VDGPDIDDACHADEDIDVTIIIPGSRERCGHRGFVGDITMDPSGDSARRPDRVRDQLPATCPPPQVTIIVILPMAERFAQSAGTVLEFALASRFDNWPGLHTIQSWQRLQL
jgi:hypothetical protein